MPHTGHALTNLQEAILNSLEDGILIVDNSGKVVFFNKSFRSIWNVPGSLPAEGTIEELLVVMADNLEAGDSKTFGASAALDAPAAGRVVDLRLKGKRIIEQCCSPLDCELHAAYAIWRFRDVTLLRKKQLTTEVSNKQLTDIIEFLPEPTMVINEDGVIVVWNKAIEDVSGVKK